MGLKIHPLDPISPGFASSSFKLFYIENFPGLDGDQSRLSFRKICAQLLQEQKFSIPIDILDLNKRPSHPQLHISLSHCKNAGLVGWSLKPSKIGVDIEQISRLTEPVIQRVSTTEEVLGAPQPSLLWSCKEAAFKSHSETINVMSSVDVFDWQPLQNNIWFFKARLTENKSILLGSGEIRLTQGHSLAFFLPHH